MKIGYLVHNLNDAAVERRCRMFEAGGATVRPAGFCRDAEVAEPISARGALNIGRSHDAALAKRALSTFQNIAFAGPLKRYFGDCDIMVARNLEQLAMAARVADGRPLVYECLDIHRALLGSGPAARAVQAVEAYLLPKCDLLITSSPAFVRNHFAHRPLEAETLLIENKLLLNPIDADLPPNPVRASARPLVIGWFGMLRCRRTLAFLTDLVRSSEGGIEVIIAGKPSPAELPDLERQVAAQPGMAFLGPYTYADLPDLYGRCDFAWSIDWFEDGLNSAWLLPNRLYEAITFGAIPIALADVEVGAWLNRHGAGLVAATAEDAANHLSSMSDSQLASMKADIARIDQTDTVCRQRECDELVEKLKGLSPR